MLGIMLILDMKNLRRSGGKYGIFGAPREDNIFTWVNVYISLS
jgi:hypothetical protein